MLPEFILDCLQPQLNSEAVRLAVHPETSDNIKRFCYELGIANDMATCKAFFSQLTWATLDEWKSLRGVPILIVQGKDDLITTVDNALKLYEEIINCKEFEEIRLSSTTEAFVDRGLYSFKVVEKAGTQLNFELLIC
jgi:pimeloyl-ACP methyl ester carboxylesterase